MGKVTADQIGVAIDDAVYILIIPLSVMSFFVVPLGLDALVFSISSLF